MRRWPLLVILALAPVWIIGILCRSAWTPDEPREADIAWRMTLQSDRTLPQLADTPFLEKPPLSYWMSAAAIEVYGDSPAAARVPNLLYAAIVALAIGALAFAMDGGTAAIIAALVAGTAVTAFRVSIWLAPDACLLAGCAIALLGAYLGFRAPPGRSKLFGYGIQLREKQKVKRIYGLLERPFRLTFQRAERRKGITGANLLQELERRLDNVAFSLGFAASRAQARQLVCHGHVTVNGRKVTIPSFRVSKGNVVAIKEKSRSNEQIKASVETARARGVPGWLDLQPESFSGTVLELPSREEIKLPIQEQLIVELYSK